MRDCPNAEMRDRLPELAAGTLAAESLALVRLHLEECGDCREELALIQAIRANARRVPAIDTSRIVSALPSHSRVTASRMTRWSTPLRIAAAIGALAAGIAGYQATRSTPERTAVTRQDSAVVATAPTDSVVSPDSATSPSPSPSALSPASSKAIAMADSKPALGFDGGLDDLSPEQLDALATELEGLDGSAMLGADPVEPEVVAPSEPLPPDTTSSRSAP